MNIYSAYALVHNSVGPRYTCVCCEAAVAGDQQTLTPGGRAHVATVDQQSPRSAVDLFYSLFILTLRKVTGAGLNTPRARLLKAFAPPPTRHTVNEVR